MKSLSRNMKGMACASALLLLVFPQAIHAQVSPDLVGKFTNIPINLTGNDVAPLVMMNVSRDHQLSYKAYNDYSDLDGDGNVETTYDDAIEYYGYFDSAKCYTYDTTNNYFVPAAMATGPNNHYCSSQWSGNFMNWATMTRMDIVRKILYGGTRSTDTSSLTVLERQYLPTDAHAFAKYYNGNDIADLTPFTAIATTPPSATSTSSRDFPTHTSGTEDRSFSTTLSATYGDQILVYRTGFETTHWMIGGVSATASGSLTIRIPADSYAGSGTYAAWTLKNLSATGITFANMTRGTTSGDNRYSDTNDNPPLIRVAEGNFALWTANERWQAYWSNEKSNTQSSFTGGFRSNGNKAFLSGINASAENPSQATHGLGSGIRQGEFVARVKVADSALLGTEKVKNYNGTYKPIGLLQVYGENDQIFFGLLTGTYEKNISGGVLRKNVASFSDEVNTTDGTFDTSADGIVDNLDRLRLYGYDYNDGTYRGRDDCTYQQTGLVTSGGSESQGAPANQGNCSSWGNPMSEMYYESLRYLAGKSATPDFTYGSGSKDADLGLTVATWSDPLDSSNYCAALNVLNFNASVSSYDGDQLTAASDLGCTQTAAELTDAVGIHEGIDSSSWFIGSNGVFSNELCSSKGIGGGFGDFSGLCPEAPTQEGTYKMSGLAHYANTNRIRTDLTVPPARANSRDLMVSTYGIALATNVPKIEIATGSGNVTILPAYRLDVSSNGSGPFGGGTLVDFKIITQTPTYGKFYVNWEDSEMGGDYDQDMWGIIEYQVSGNTVTITTNAVSASTANGQGFGYIISGTDKDGPHFHSGIYNFDYTDPTGVLGCNNCTVHDLATSVAYTITGSSAGILEDPLLYAAKWGGFIDDNNDQLPLQQDEWDARNNSDGSSSSDGIPDNYYYATNPLQLESSLNRVFLTILQRASSGTAAAVVSNNVSGVGALYQAYYEPLRRDVSDNEVSWIGTVQALWLDNYSYLREDNGDAVLGDYYTDPVIQQFYDEVENKTKIRRYTSTQADTFTPYYMQGTVTNYDAGTGALTFEVEEISGTVGDGPFASWTIYNLSEGTTASSNTSASIISVTTPTATQTSFTVTSPTTGWATVGDTVMVAHFQSTDIALEDINSLWNAREMLGFTIAQPETQRTFSFPADDSITGGRHIITWLDINGNSVVDTGEIVDFDSDTTFDATTANYGYLNVATAAEGENVVDYVRGKEIAGYRNRTINYDGSGSKVIRLADVVNATPTVVGAPREALDLLYKDNSYGLFRKQYAKRRQVLYVGSNGGMLHAFNGGFYNSATQSFDVAGSKYDGTAAVQHPLGAEIWSYVPMNLLPHLKWLTDVDYPHVYYVDGKPKVFDAKIFDSADPDYPGGWGTVLVVGMRFGGGGMTVDTAADGLTGGTDDRLFSSAYVILDITNPENQPKVLAEIQVPNGSFSTSYPAAFKVKYNDPVLDNNKWFLTFGSGPTDMTGNSNQYATFYIFDLEEITSPGTTSAVPAGCVQEPVGSGGTMNILACDTGVANSFVGDPITVDWNLDYRDDNAYFGVIGDTAATSGRAMRFNINGDDDAANWIGPQTLIDTSQPVVSAVTPGVDGTGQKWIYFGTGRLFDSPDQLTTAIQSIYGVKEDGASTVLKADLFDTTNVEVQTDGVVSGAGSNTTFADMEQDIEDNYDGWYLDMPLIQGTAGIDPATRVINASALAGGVLFSTAYQPGLDLCTGEGSSRLYGLYYRTGTAFPNPAILGTRTEVIGGTEYVYANPYIELGHGFATTPSIHTGAGNSGNEVSVFTQLSTGAVNRTEAETIMSVRSGMRAWNEPK